MTKARIEEIKELLYESDFVCDPDQCREVILELIKEVEYGKYIREEPNHSLLES